MADRLLFSKTGRAKYISHLDLMRTFQRAFARAQIRIKHTEGFNPHPFVSIALPLSVGYSSQCEILEFGLMGDMPYDQVPQRLTAAMPEGIVIHQCYPAQRKLKELASINYIMNFEYSEGRPQEAEPAMQALLNQESLEPGVPERHHDPGRGAVRPESRPEPGAPPGRLLPGLPRICPRLRHLPQKRGAGRRGKSISITRSSALSFCLCGRTGRFFTAGPKRAVRRPTPAGRSRGR